MATNEKKGLLLVNLGTPGAPRVREVRQYLKEFLMDRRVIDLPLFFRTLLVYGVILPLRPKKSAEAYSKIWTDLGSPLLVHSLRLREKVKDALSNQAAHGETPVELGMRYGEPSISSALAKLMSEGVTALRVIPLYPQFSLASTQSVLDHLDQVIPESLKEKTEVKIDFFQDPEFVNAFSEQGKKSLADFAPDHVLFSFHGVPERHVKKTDRTGATCLPESSTSGAAVSYGSCCEVLTSDNRFCYRAQCFATARAIAKELGLTPDKYSVSFQSRLGRTPWIQPFTDFRYGELVKAGVKKLLVYSPSFVADCLETLEEIEIRGREQFQKEGGVDLKLVPSLNSSDAFGDAIVAWAQDQAHAQSEKSPHFVPLSEAMKPFGSVK